MLQLLHNLKREGAQTMVANLSRSIEPGAATVTVYPWREGGAYVTELSRAGICVIKPPTFRWPGLARAALRLRRFVRRHKVDVVHAHMSDSAILAAFALVGTGIPFVVTHHSNRLLPAEVGLRRAIRRNLIHLASRRAASNVGVTEKVEGLLRTELGLPASKICCIANGVAVPEEKVAQAAIANRNTRRSGANWPRIVMLGRLAPVKRQDLGIEAMGHVAAQLPEARLVIAGDGPLKQDLIDRAEKLGLDQTVHVTGPTDDVAGLLREADIFVSTSSYEGLPIAVLEAMSWGIPVVATDVPGHGDVIADGLDGHLVPFGEPKALAEAILAIAGDAKGTLDTGPAARRKVCGAYSSARMASAYMHVYRSVLQNSESQARNHHSAENETVST